MPDTTERTPEQRAREAAYRRAYRRGFRKRKALKIPDPALPGSECMEPLDVLLSLDVSEPSSITRLLRGLRWHVALGTLTANAASQIMRFAREEAAAAPRAKAPTLSRSAQALLGATPPSAPPGNQGERSQSDPTAFPGSEAQGGESEKSERGERGTSPAATERSGGWGKRSAP